MERYLLHLLVINSVLVLCDAALGYFLAPVLCRFGKGDNGTQHLTVLAVRRLLSVLVALYMFFNCLAYFRGNSTLLFIVTIIVTLDILLQLILRWKSKREGLL